MSYLYLVFFWVRPILDELNTWFSPVPLPDDAKTSSEYIKRISMHNNWYDNLALWWVDKSKVEKFGVFASLTCTSALIGLYVGAPVILAVITATIFNILHGLFYTNVVGKLQGAIVLAAENIRHENQMIECKIFYTQALSNIQANVDTLNQNRQQHDESLTKLIKKYEDVSIDIEALQSSASDVNSALLAIRDKEKNMEVRLNNLGEHVSTFTNSLNDTQTNVTDFNDKSAKTLDAIDNLKNRHDLLNASIAKFSLFADKKLSSLPTEADDEAVEQSSKQFLESVDCQIAEADKFIQERSLSASL